MSALPYLHLGAAATTARSFDLVKLAQECCYHNNRGIAAHGVRILTNISASCQDKGKWEQGQWNKFICNQAYALHVLLTGFVHEFFCKSVWSSSSGYGDYNLYKCFVGFCEWLGRFHLLLICKKDNGGSRTAKIKACLTFAINHWIVC